MNNLPELDVKNSTVCYLPNERMGYFAWPSVIRLTNNRLVVGASGFRFDHVCPWGKTVLFFSDDDGDSWTTGRVVNNTPLDDRDCGLVHLGDNQILLSWFSSDIRPHYDWAKKGYQLDHDECKRWEAVFDSYSDKVIEKWNHSWIRISPDGEAWGDFIPVPVSSPHGPILLKDGNLLYLGKRIYPMPNEAPIASERQSIEAYLSKDGAATWKYLGTVPLAKATTAENYHEPHVVELADGTLVGLIRFQVKDSDSPIDQSFCMYQTESQDGGKTWSTARALGIAGSPPHLIHHSSGAIICSYCKRRGTHSQNVMISKDNCKTWIEYCLRNDVPFRDHGYPCSVELGDGSILTVYYQRGDDEHKNTGIFQSRWRLPD